MFRRKYWVRLLLGVLGALLAAQAYPNSGIWILVFPAVALILLSVVHVNARHSFLNGWLIGFVFYAAQIPWMTVYLGPVPWLALSILEGLIFAAGALAINLLWHFAKKTIPNSPLLIALAIAALWVSREWLASNFPYGGFPWSRLALSQANSPLAPWVYWGGNSLLSFVIVFITALIILTWQKELRPENWGTSPVALVFAILIMVPLLTPQSANSVGHIRVAAVQGNANAGLFANPIPGEILQNHLSASLPLIKNGEKVDLVIWPENAADKSPLSSSDSKWEITNFTARINAPLMFGTITERSNEIYNSSILWLPKVGPVDWYDKKRPVAFGEFVPDRQFWRMLAPDLIDLIPRGYSFGSRDGIFEITKAKIGTMICFEIAVDDISRDLVNAGAEVLVVQTNNSDFGHTNESAQQLAIAKLRAIETARSLVNISTVGLSAIYLPNGKQIDSLPSFKPGLMIQDIPLSREITPAMMFGKSFDLVVNFSALAQVVLVLVFTWRKRRQNAK